MIKNQGQFFSHRTENNEHEAVVLLDRFTKEFCIDATVSDDLAFRCTECPFLRDKDICSVKEFKCKFDPNYKDFGSMGDL